MKTISLPCYNITVKLNNPDGHIKCAFDQGAITSDLHETAANYPITADEYDASVNAIESLILAHAVAGIDIESPAYIEGIETAVEAILNHTT